MSFKNANAQLDDLLDSDFDRMRRIASRLKELEDSNDKEVFEIAHLFANVAAPIRGNIGLGKPLEKILEVCDHARDRLKDFELSVDGETIQTVHSETFLMTQRECLDILKSVRFKITANKDLLGPT